ncbi:hypothetical protein K438DRAFT_1942836 [Mycena galopus ATCC 62051]|nr:hypothetical protein K438DRAFT_1942836 [Mycena galopus ATCC 62051]
MDSVLTHEVWPQVSHRPRRSSSCLKFPSSCSIRQDNPSPRHHAVLEGVKFFSIHVKTSPRPLDARVPGCHAFKPLFSPIMEQHPCYRNPNPSSRLKPNTVFSLKYIKMYTKSIPANYPYALPPIDGLYGKVKVFEYLPLPFFEFRGAGAPPADLGTPGDVYIDLTPGAHALYCKCEEDWACWAARAPTEELLTHPHLVGWKYERYLDFHAEKGPEWICRKTVLQRQQAVLAAGLLDTGGAQEGSGLASTMIARYIAKTAASVANFARATPMDVDSPDISASDSDLDSEEISDAESKHSDTFYPSKRARTLASCNSLSTSLAAGRAARSKAPGPSPQYQHPGPDPETQQLEKELAALRADKNLQRMRAASASSWCLSSLRADFGSLQRCSRHSRPSTANTSYIDPSPVTPAEAKQLLPDLRNTVDKGGSFLAVVLEFPGLFLISDLGKKTLLEAKMKRAKAEKQLEEQFPFLEAHCLASATAFRAGSQHNKLFTHYIVLKGGRNGKGAFTQHELHEQPVSGRMSKVFKFRKDQGVFDAHVFPIDPVGQHEISS